MNADDEQLLRRRVYGADHDDPDPGPQPGRSYAELVGGPLDGLLLDIHGWRTEDIDDGVALTTELARWPGGPAAAPCTTRASTNPVRLAPASAVGSTTPATRPDVHASS